MVENVWNWLIANYVEVLGAILGFVYIILSIEQRIWTWPVGLLTSALYVYVFFVSKFYADMALQVYYIAVSIYGWYHWLKGSPEKKDHLPVIVTPRKQWWWLVAASVVLFLLIVFVLKNYTDSPVPVGDSLTTALSLVATWMLARKYIEHWLIWIFVDFLSAILYALKSMWPTVILFVIYTVMAVLGYFQWRKAMMAEQNK